MKKYNSLLIAFTLLLLARPVHLAACSQSSSQKKPSSPAHAAKVSAKPKKKPARRVGRVRRPVPKAPTYGNPSLSDDSGGEDPVVRQAAVEALGRLMGSIVAVDPNSGRVLTIVNQKMALGSGYQPCSTFKPAVALAALEEGVIENNRTRLRLGKSWHMNLRESLAISNNQYFATLGKLLGIEKLREYAKLFGFGERAGWGIEEESPSDFPEKAPSARQGGVGRLASFGQGISQTLLQLASFTSALANGGTLYYLQYPRNSEQVENFQPRVKRQLDIDRWLPPIREGMEQAVLTGTARRARQPDVAILGKTGTCSQDGARLGWFAGYNQQDGGLAVVVLLRGGRAMTGSLASEVSGRFFRKLADQNYFARSVVKDLHSAPPAVIQLPGIH